MKLQEGKSYASPPQNHIWKSTCTQATAPFLSTKLRPLTCKDLTISKYLDNTYIRSYHQLVHWGERQREHVQTLQNLVSHCALYQTSQIPIKFEKQMVINSTNTFLGLMNGYVFIKDFNYINAWMSFKLKAACHGFTSQNGSKGLKP